LQAGSVVATLAYDGLGRRIAKAVTNCGDWDGTYHYYYDGQRMIETRNGSDQVLTQYVWGLTYVDELIQIAHNQDPENADEGITENVCERFFCVLQDANYNVLGVVNPSGGLVERYEYTPYGRRTVYTHGWHGGDYDNDGVLGENDVSLWQADYGSGDPASPADPTGDGVVDLSDGQVFGAGSTAGWPRCANDPKVMCPVLDSSRLDRGPLGTGLAGLCDIGHQGLLYDREFGLYYNRARMLNPTLGRFMQRDPAGYVDGMSLYVYEKSSPSLGRDPFGLWDSGGPDCDDASKEAKCREARADCVRNCQKSNGGRRTGGGGLLPPMNARTACLLRCDIAYDRCIEGKCCGGESYDSGRKRCCHGELHPRSFAGRETCCKGPGEREMGLIYWGWELDWHNFSSYDECVDMMTGTFHGKGADPLWKLGLGFASCAGGVALDALGNESLGTTIGGAALGATGLVLGGDALVWELWGPKPEEVARGYCGSRWCR